MKRKIINENEKELFDVSKKTASRELANIVAKKVFKRKGVTGKGTFYTLSVKGVIKGS